MSEAADASLSGPWRAAVAAALVLALVSAVTGIVSLGEIQTGEYSERITFAEAKQMAAGEHRYGIVEYTHFPNGPIYVVAVMTALEIPRHAMRWLPIGVMAAAVGLLAYALWIQTASALAQIWILTGLATLVVQPGVAQWQGALHEHSYVLSQSLAGLAIAVLLTPRFTWLLLPFGFVAGWTGYDFLPGQACMVLLGRWLVLCREEDADLVRAALLSALDTLKFVSGVALAVLAHLLQLALFFESLEAGLRDLLGSAVARAGTSSLGVVEPDYREFITKEAQWLQPVLEERPDFETRFGEDYDTLDPPRFRLPGIILAYFLEPRWTRAGEIAGAAFCAVLVALEQLRRARATRQGAGPDRAVVFAVALAIAVASGISWSLLMRVHAGQHFHMIPRHYFMIWASIVAIPVLVFATGPVRIQAAAPALRAGLTQAAFYAVPLVALVGALLFLVIGAE